MSLTSFNFKERARQGGRPPLRAFCWTESSDERKSRRGLLQLYASHASFPRPLPGNTICRLPRADHSFIRPHSARNQAESGRWWCIATLARESALDSASRALLRPARACAMLAAIGCWAGWIGSR